MQTQGIGQINTAVSQMDKVTQSNAGGAEETAAAAEELNAQSHALRESVGDLRRLVGGSSTGATKTVAHATSAVPTRPPRPRAPPLHAAPSPRRLSPPPEPPAQTDSPTPDPLSPRRRVHAAGAMAGAKRSNECSARARRTVSASTAGVTDCFGSSPMPRTGSTCASMHRPSAP